MSSRRNWDSPAAMGVGEIQFRRLEKKLSTLPTLWGQPSMPLSQSLIVTINVPVVYMVRYKVDSPLSKLLCTAPYKQQVHWLFYVPAMDI